MSATTPAASKVYADASSALQGLLRDGMTIMIGGFMGVGAPPRLISALLNSNVKDLTLISTDTAFVDTGVGPLVDDLVG